MRDDSHFVVAFFDETRNVSLGEHRSLAATADDVLRIAKNPIMRDEFRRQLSRVNDADLRDVIVQHVLDLADEAEDSANEANRGVDLVDRGGLGIAASITATGIGTTSVAVLAAKTAAAASILGPVGLLVGGLVGVAASAFGRHRLKLRADQSKLAAQTLRRLVGK